MDTAFRHQLLWEVWPYQKPKNHNVPNASPGGCSMWLRLVWRRSVGQPVFCSLALQKKILYLDPTLWWTDLCSSAAVNTRVSRWGGCGLWPMSASTKGHGPAPVWAPALQSVEVWAGPRPSLLVTMEASTIQGMSDPLLHHREARNVFYLERKDPSTDQF